MPIISKNPATEEIIAVFSELSEKEIDQKLTLSNKAFSKWSKTSFEIRKKHMLELVKILRGNKEEFARLITTEMGKPITSAIEEIEKSASTAEYFALNSEKLLMPEHIESDAVTSYVRFDPLGPILGIMPWNAPFWQIIRFVVPIIMAGNVALVKPASNVPQITIELQKLFLKAGFQKGVFQTLFITSSKVYNIINDNRIVGVALTGSVEAGKAVASQAGSQIKKTVLELGGSDPFIVFNDADLALAAQKGIDSRFKHNGQSCNAAKRFIVVKSVANEFIKLLKGVIMTKKVGNPLDKDTVIGPLATEHALKVIDRQVKLSVTMGAKIIVGGKTIRINPRGRRGYFYEPTILTNVKRGMPVYDEEVFGPVLAVIVVKNENEAIKIANDSIFGLGASIWTRSKSLAEKYIPLIEAGNVFVNGVVKSDARLPYGGIKQSGYGKELSSYGIKEFVNIKTVWIGKI